MSSAAEADLECRLLLSNADLGVPLMARDVQAGLDFQKRPRELFEGQAMGEDALRLLGEYRNLLQEVRETVGKKGVLKKHCNGKKPWRLLLSPLFRCE